MQIYFPYLLPFAIFIILFIEWFLYGRDPSKMKTFPMRYAAPKGLTPAEAGTIIDELADVQDIIATFIDLAIRKHFVIHDAGDDFEFELAQDYEDDPGIEKHERALLKAVFGRQKKVKFSEIKVNLKHDKLFIVEELYEAVAQKGFFEKNPRKVRGRFISIGVLFAFLTFAAPLAIGWLQYKGLWTDVPAQHVLFALLASTLLFFVFSIFMPKRTKKGHAIYEYLLGLEKFIRNPEDKPKGYAEEKIAFEKLLPYAVIFSATEEWTGINALVYGNSSPAFWKMKSGAAVHASHLADRINSLIASI